MPRMRRQSREHLARIQRERYDANLANSPSDRAIADFEKYMKDLIPSTCASCKETLWRHQLTPQGCRACKNGSTLFSDNNGMDLGEVPTELQGLSMIEQILIARVHPVVSVFKIRGQQTAYSGHTLNFVQHIDSIATRLPHDPASLTSVVLLNRNTPHGLTQFRVRSGIVRRALIWLKANNVFYSDIIIDQQNLDNLPADGDAVDLLPNHADGPDAPVEENGNFNNVIDSSCYPNLPAIDAASAIDRNLQRIQSQSTQEADWPDVSQNALNEFNTEGIIVKAFPCLFPYGRGDLRSPRETRIPAKDYFKHLMNYHDGRFARDTRFPYFAYNTLARWDALNAGNVYIRLNNMGDRTNEELRELVNDPENNLADQIMYHGATLRGTRAFWRQRCSELTQMVTQLGTPAVFFTLSAADYHWPDLFRLLIPGVDARTIPERQRWKLMHDNPMITAKFFDERSRIFMAKVIQKIFSVKDFWYRFEWQHRGSPHVHGLIWLEDAPECDSINAMSEEERANVVNYFDSLVSATIDNPIASIPIDQNPCRQRYTDLTPEQKSRDLDRLLSSVQTHSRCGPHCMRKKRGSRVEQCRYGFPIQLEEQSSLRLDEGSWKFIPKRNNQFIQRYNKLITQFWRGNTDFSPITSKEAVLRYITKYASKGEYPSQAYSEILERFVNRNPDDAPAPTLIRQLLVSSVAERNYSAQEVMHLLMGWPLYHASRTFIILNTAERWRRLVGNDSQSALLQAYATREEYDDLSLMKFARDYRLSGNQIILRAKSVIVRVIPYLKPSEDSDANEDYFKQQCQLHLPWRTSVESILPAGSTWEELFIENIETIASQNDELNLELPAADEVEYENNPLDHAQIVRDAAMAASRLNPAAQHNDPLGHRPIDEAFEWATSTSAGITRDDINAFNRTARVAELQPQERGQSIPFDSMSPAQQEVLRLCRQQIENPNHSIKRVLIQGKAGTGKSAVIKAMCEMIEQAGQTHQVLAPTGAAALNVDGKTLHSFLHIPVSNNLTPLNGENQRLFQLEVQKVKFIIIDEYSMVGLRLLTKIHKRLQEARGNESEPFGGFFIYFFGDIRQLPPVLDTAIYMAPRDDFSRIAVGLVQSIQQKIQLTVCHRQNADQTQFKRVLDGIASGTVTLDDWRLLMTRRSSIPLSNRSQFKDAVHLFPTNILVREHNKNTLARNQLAVVEIEAEHNNATAVNGDDALAQGLSKRLYLSLGCRIMLRKNLDVSRGLVNGSLGTVRNIIFRDDQRPPALPLCLLIEFDRYNGPTIRDNLYPLQPLNVHWKSRGVDCTRRQFPINLAYALTIHKAQGLTLERAIVDIGTREASAGLTYVALSRVKKLEDLILNSFDYGRLSDISKSKHIVERENFLRSMSFVNNE